MNSVTQIEENIKANDKAMPPRHFWRRIVAFGIDQLVISLAFVALVFVLSKLPLGIAPISFFSWSSCQPVVSAPLVSKVESLWPLLPGEVRENRSCSLSSLDEHQRMFVSTVVSINGSTKTSRSVTFLTNVNGVAIDPSSVPLDWVPFANLLWVPLCAALFIVKGRVSPGKKILSIKVVTEDDAALTFVKALKRETLKLAPVLLFQLIVLINGLVVAHTITTFEAAIEISKAQTNASILLALWPNFLTIVLVAIWWIYPFVMWKGQLMYDRIVGCKVVRQVYSGPPLIERPTAV